MSRWLYLLGSESERDIHYSGSELEKQTERIFSLKEVFSDLQCSIRAMLQSE